MSIEKLMSLEESANERSGFDPEAAWRIIAATGCKRVSAEAIEKVGRSLAQSTPRERAIGLVGRATAGERGPVEAINKHTEPWVGSFIGFLGSKPAVKEVQASMVREHEKKAQADDLSIYDDVMAAVKPVADTVTQYGGEDNLGDYLLRRYQKKRYMSKAVKNYTNGRVVRPPVWWNKGSDEWYRMLDTKAKRALFSDVL